MVIEAKQGGNLKIAYNAGISDMSVAMDEIELTPENIYKKAIDVKKRLPDLEPIILKDFYLACLYAQDVIKGRWLELILWHLISRS